MLVPPFSSSLDSVVGSGLGFVSVVGSMLGFASVVASGSIIGITGFSFNQVTLVCIFLSNIIVNITK